MQVSEILNVIGAGVPTILGGDLHAEPDARELQPLFRRLRDACGRSPVGSADALSLRRSGAYLLAGKPSFLGLRSSLSRADIVVHPLASA
jgi:hypothetical protein